MVGDSDEHVPATPAGGPQPQPGSRPRDLIARFVRTPTAARVAAVALGLALVPLFLLPGGRGGSATDSEPPAVSLEQPVEGSTGTQQTPSFSGGAGTSGGDRSSVTVRVYSGEQAAGVALLSWGATAGGGIWSTTAPSPLVPGTYTARVEQSDEAGNLGLSDASTFTVASTPVVSRYRNLLMSDDPVGYWRFGELRGEYAESQTNTDGTYFGDVELGVAGAVAGDPSRAARFNGFDGDVWVQDDAGDFDFTEGMTVEAWVRPATVPTDSATVLRKDGQYMLRVDGTGAVVFRTWKGRSTTEATTQPALVSPGRWTHVAATWDGAVMTVFVNGEQHASALQTAPLDVTDNTLHLATAGNYDWWAGDLDEVAVYDRALSSETLRQHVDAGGPQVDLMTPTAGSTMDARPNFGGVASTSAVDSTSVVVSVYEGPGATGSPLLTVPTTSSATGTFSVRAPSALGSGTYTAQAEQVNGEGVVGRSAPATFTVDAAAPPALLLAGGIAGCDTYGDEATALLLDRLRGVVAPLGGLAYPAGSATEFAECYDPTWGRHRSRTVPVLGSHEYNTPDAAGFFGYWGRPADSTGFFSYELGEWHVVVLNSECVNVGGCDAGSEEEQWLREDLAAHPARCTVALMHEPRFSSGEVHGSRSSLLDLWTAMDEGGVDVVAAGDEHVYERFAPQTPTGVRDERQGIRQFTVGTGGRAHYGFGPPLRTSQVRDRSTYGVLQLTLRPGAYDWRFVPEAGGRFTDRGSSSCH